MDVVLAPLAGPEPERFPGDPLARWALARLVDAIAGLSEDVTYRILRWLMEGLPEARLICEEPEDLCFCCHTPRAYFNQCNITACYWWVHDNVGHNLYSDHIMNAMRNICSFRCQVAANICLNGFRKTMLSDNEEAKQAVVDTLNMWANQCLPLTILPSDS
jgi:hypothetical protein